MMPRYLKRRANDLKSLSIPVYPSAHQTNVGSSEPNSCLVRLCIIPQLQKIIVISVIHNDWTMKHRKDYA